MAGVCNYVEHIWRAILSHFGSIGYTKIYEKEYHNETLCGTLFFLTFYTRVRIRHVRRHLIILILFN